ncbi:MAG: hypothetical protein ACREFX_09545 [Opitutaceae bacterium]
MKSPQDALRGHAEAIIRRHALLAGAAALVPEGMLCAGAVASVQLEMLAALARLYGVPFAPKTERILLTAGLAGALTDCVVALPFVRRILGALAPFVLPLWFIGSAVTAAGFTHAFGRAVTRHYESGGTMRTFDWAGFRGDIGRKLGLPAPDRAASEPA